jgi:hypothetical protein
MATKMTDLNLDGADFETFQLDGTPEVNQANPLARFVGMPVLPVALPIGALELILRGAAGPLPHYDAPQLHAAIKMANDQIQEQVDAINNVGAKKATSKRRASRRGKKS